MSPRSGDRSFGRGAITSKWCPSQSGAENVKPLVFRSFGAIPTSLQGDQNGRWNFVVFDPASHSKASTVKVRSWEMRVGPELRVEPAHEQEAQLVHEREGPRHRMTVGRSTTMDEYARCPEPSRPVTSDLRRTERPPSNTPCSRTCNKVKQPVPARADVALVSGAVLAVAAFGRHLAWIGTLKSSTYR
jgi:hypothetical protein